MRRYDRPNLSEILTMIIVGAGFGLTLRYFINFLCYMISSH